MSIQWNIYINNTEVEEPQGWADVVLNIKRDDVWHGIFFEASTSTLQFYGTGAALLQAEKQSNGLAATATFRAEAYCGDETGIQVLEGKFDFGTYNEKCGNLCIVEISIEKAGCIMTLRNRYDQQVDLQQTTSFNKTTLLEAYPGLDFEIELTAQKLAVGNEAEMSDESVTEVISDNVNWTDSDGFNNYIGWIAPPLPVVTNESLGVFNASPIIDLAGPLEGVPNRPPYPDFPTATGTATLLGGITCSLTDTVLSFRLKGTGSVVFSGGAAVGLTAKVFKLPSGLDGTVAVNWVSLYSTLLWGAVGTGSSTFDLSASVSLSIEQGDFIYFGISTRGDSLNNIDNFTLSFDTETFFKLLSSGECEPTNAVVSMVNEVGSRLAESITDRCLTMKSDYYGRTDSEPYQSDEDGCGSFRVLSNGLKIRNATPSNHFISLQEFFTGLRGIDNIGMGIEDNTVVGTGEWLRIEPVEYFYQDVKLLSMPFVPDANNRLEPTMGFSKVKIGYQKWEVERVNGLNEFNSNKEFRTSLETINNELDATSNFIAGGIPIEITRQQSFSASGAADSKYDNDTFVICIERDVTPQDRESFFGVATPGQFFFEMSGGNFLGVGSVVSVSGTSLNDGNYTILTITNDGFYYYFTTVEPTVLENFVTATYTYVSGYFGVILVEKNNIATPANIYSPATVYNWRIRPMYNLMRWFKSIAHVYVNLANTTSKLFFSSGTGNYLAEGTLNMYGQDPCSLENNVVAENDDLSKANFAHDDWVPIYQPETIQFSYPLSIAEYITIKANPYGYINVQCGNGNFEKAFIKSIEYKPAQGEANFTLIKKWP